jgi:predicted amidohydrolase YtcJ
MDHDGYTWHDIEVFITRKDAKGKVWGPQERVDHATALKMITRWAAEYVLKPDKIGSIEPGKLADLVVLNQDYMTVPDEQVSETQSRMTILNGRIAYIHKDLAQEYNLRPAGAIISTYEELKARRNPFGFSAGGG